MNRVSVTYEKNAAWITLKNLSVNVIDIAMMEELSSAISEVEARADVPAMVIRGEGENFSAGVDIAAH
ncbi:MAG TPA: enoyl-CoA hydratase-related protein, partial [Terriglobales bacterium]|nr:enoyl-CoA hydratase-related protein [Terriglobales bacterium]